MCKGARYTGSLSATCPEVCPNGKAKKEGDIARLVELFDQQRETLQQRLGAEASPERVVREVRQALDEVRARYLDSEPVRARRRLAPFVLDVVKASLVALLAANRAETWRRSEGLEPSRHHFGLPLRWRLVQGAGALVLLLWLWGRGEGVAVLLSLLLIGSEVFRWLPDSWLPVRLQVAGSPDTLAEPPAEIRVRLDLNPFFAAVADALVTADKVLAEADTLTERHPSDAPGLAAHPQLLELLQDLLEAKHAGDEAYALRMARAVPALLSHYEVRADVFRGDNPQHFEFLPSLDPSDTELRTLTPALIQGETLLSRGRVLEPEFAEPSPEPSPEPSSGSGRAK
ncbi:MAG: hypothetical protein U5L04_11630 [Trueperaceae bacterium]|nr:hypothetical protein [Trueperaceae bacterium]